MGRTGQISKASSRGGCSNVTSVRHLCGATKHIMHQRTTLGNLHRAGVPPLTSLLQKHDTALPIFWSDALLLHQTILGMCPGKPGAFLPHYLSFSRNEEQILFPSSLSCIRMLPRKCKKKHLCPQPTSEDTWSVQLFGH